MARLWGHNARTNAALQPRDERRVHWIPRGSSERLSQVCVWSRPILASGALHCSNSTHTCLDVSAALDIVTFSALPRQPLQRAIDVQVYCAITNSSGVQKPLAIRIICYSQGSSDRIRRYQGYFNPFVMRKVGNARVCHVELFMCHRLLVGF